MTRSFSTLMTRLRSGEPLAMLWQSLNHPFVAELLARAGFDVCCVDMQHGLSRDNDLIPMIQAADLSGVPVIVRVPSNDAQTIAKALDAGAQGIIVPLVNTAEQAAALVSACRYPPEGSRSYGPLRAAQVYGADYAQHANTNVASFAMIETAEGLKNLEAICATPGLTGIFIGPADLSYALNLPPKADNEHPEHLRTIKHIIQTCQRFNLIVGLYSENTSFAKRMIQEGVQLIVVASDSKTIQNTAKQKLELFRS